jgi:hypothetical protein
VFLRIPHDRLTSAVAFLLERFRTAATGVGVPAGTPIHVTETGWPTGAGRDEATQRAVLGTVARAVISAGAGVTAYELFGLRDGRSDAAWSSRFGLMRDDYTPKPAYHAIRDLIAGCSGPGA